MYAGAIVEIGPTSAVCSEPMHPYTRLLLDSVLPPRPVKLPWEQAEEIREGAVGASSSGCPFAPRCKQATEYCREHLPMLLEHAEQRFAACHNRVLNQ